MNIDLLIIDNFYNDPDSVRAFALEQTFTTKGNFPGSRTVPFLTPDMITAIQYAMQFAGKITTWHNDDPGTAYSGSFQLATAQDRTWIHADHHNMWSGVCYLTPNAPHTAGTGLYRHKQTNNHRYTDSYYEGYDYTKWDLFDVIGNKYNRLVIYRGDLFHASLDYFGSTKEDCRLFQTFFFDTERY